MYFPEMSYGHTPTQLHTAAHTHVWDAGTDVFKNKVGDSEKM